MKVIFRVDASTQIGVGHIMRCYSLAEHLLRIGVSVVFICRQQSGDCINWLKDNGFPVDVLISRSSGSVPEKHPDSHEIGKEEIQEVRDIIGRHGVVDWLVVDHYSLGFDWERAMRPLVGSILSIDDLANRPHDCDVLLDQNYFAQPQVRYAGLLPENASSLLGPRYALLRPEFAEKRHAKSDRDGEVKRILVFMGGGDSANTTSIVLQALIRHHQFLENIFVDVVLGSSNPHGESVSLLIEHFPWITLYRHTNQMAELMFQADLAIGAAGSSNWERACLALPSLVFAFADNQVEPLMALVEDGYIVGDAFAPNVDRVVHWLNVLLGNSVFLRGLSKRSALLSDGYGVRRVVSRMLQSGIVFRRATMNDGMDIYQWRNNPVVRENSFSNNPIDVSAHMQWFSNVLNDSSRIILIAKVGQEAVGVVRFDIKDGIAKISVFRVPGSKNVGGLIRSASNWLKDNMADLQGIEAEVLSKNSTSLAAFSDAGYKYEQCKLKLKFG